MQTTDAKHAGPRVTPITPPEKPQADVTAAAWWALPLPIHPRHMQATARPHMAAVADFLAALTALELADDMPAAQRLAALDRLELALSGAFGPALAHPELRPAVVLRESLLQTKGSFQDMLALADACRDTIQHGLLAGADALLQHAARTTAPVLRHFLLLHGDVQADLMERSDALSQAWFLLRLQVALTAEPAIAARRTMPDPEPMIEACLQKAAGTWRLATNAHVRRCLAHLHGTAQSLARRGAHLRLKRGADAALLPPALALAQALPLHIRLHIAWRALRAAQAAAVQAGA